MKKLLLLAAIFLAIAGFAAAQVKQGSRAWVQAKTAALKSSTGFFASKRGNLSYGDEVQVLRLSGKWAEVRSSKNSSLSGWIALASLSSKRIVASGSGSSATASEIALAGKGFNQEVENAYKAGGQLNYTDVDKTEAIAVSEDELRQFIDDGGLKAGE
ncbi:MAG: hypothetical protein LBF78_14840 [Treponema sp.]|nr:hypothetical protein [Treponema sp.]